MRRSGGHRLGELVQHRGVDQGGGRVRLPPGGAGQRRLRASRRPERHGRGDRRCVGSRSPGRRRSRRRTRPGPGRRPVHRGRRCPRADCPTRLDPGLPWRARGRHARRWRAWTRPAPARVAPFEVRGPGPMRPCLARQWIHDDFVHQHGHFHRRAVGGDRRRDHGQPGPGGRPRARHARVAVGRGGRVRGRSAHPLPANGHPGRAGRRRRRGGRGLPLSRHRQSGLGAESPPYRGRDPAALRTARSDRGHPLPPGLPGAALFPPLRHGPEPAGQLPGHALVRPGRAVRRRMGPDELRSRLPHRAAVPLRGQGAGRLRHRPLPLMAPTQRHRWLTLPDSRAKKRASRLVDFVVDQARADFVARYPNLRFGPVVGLIAAYNEADNIGDVLKAMPTMVGDLEVSTLVVVDGGSDATADAALDAGVFTCVLPVNLGQGAALRLGYELVTAYGATYVVTLDADGQNDPTELATMLEPLLADTADFVIASRVLGVDQTTDRFRRAGVTLYAWALNTLAKQQLTDSSNGYRAFRIDVLNDIVPHLVQDQYQTAEVVITASSRGWRITQQPTMWHPRASGSSKKGGNLVFGLSYAWVIGTTWARVTFGNRTRR